MGDLDGSRSLARNDGVEGSGSENNHASKGVWPDYSSSLLVSVKRNMAPKRALIAEL